MPSHHLSGNEPFDGIARLVLQHFGCCAAFVVIDGYPRGCAGLGLADATRYLPLAACDTPQVVPDLHRDARIRDAHPEHRFYAGCPLLGEDNRQIGAIGLLDRGARQLDHAGFEFLQELARQAVLNARQESAMQRMQADVRVLQDSERRMALAIAGSGTGIWDRDVPAGKIYYSPGWKALLGYAEGEVGDRIEDSYRRIHPDDIEYVKAAMLAHFAGRTETYEVEHRLRCKDGSYKWVCSRGRVVARDGDGQALRMIGTTTDVTALRSMAECLRHSAELLTDLTNAIPGMAFQYHLRPGGESRFTYVSAGIRDIYEIEPEQLAECSLQVDALIHPDDLPAYRASLDTSAASLTPWHQEYRVRLPRQGVRWRQGDACPRRLDDGSTLWHGFITDITERKQIEAELQEFATIDFLTQVSNRRHFLQQVEAELARLQRGDGGSAAILMCDLDHFKAINDRWGHAAGDQALRHFAGILRHQLRKTDKAGRMGGEEFAVVLGNSGLDEAALIARRIQLHLAETPVFEAGRRIPLTISIGIALMYPTDPCAEAAITRSDMALYRAKQRGRNRIECY